MRNRLILIVALLAASTAAYADIDPNEHDVLVAIYNATGGSGWTNATKWNSGFDACTWQNVSCDADGHVTILDLSGNNLTGTFPDVVRPATARAAPPKAACPGCNS